MHRTLPILLFVASAALAQGQDAVSKAMENPSATGLLVTEVLPGSQSADAGVLPGDIVVSYNREPTPDAETLHAAMGEASLPAEVVIEVNRAGEVKKLQVKPGKLGVAVSPVKKGEHLDALPPEADPSFDWSPLDKPGDLWMTLSMEGKKVGFEHEVWSRKESALSITCEAAFDGGKQWGLNHFVVHEEIALGARPNGAHCRFENPLSHFSSEGNIFADPKAPTAGWETQVTSPDGKTDKERGLAPGDLLPTYCLVHVARCLPRKAGTCYHFTPLNEGDGKFHRPSALVVVGQEQTRAGDKDIAAWKIEWRSAGQRLNSYWVTGEGDVVRIDFGGVVGTGSTKEAALEGLHPDIHPQTAK